MGTQWAGMGRAFMGLEPFNKAIHRCAAALAPEGLDLLNLIQNGTEETFDNILNNFVSIACIQVALVDTLTALGIKPDRIIGHSAGELGCAYADGAFTAEQTALAAYWRGKSILDAKLKIGAMAAVGGDQDSGEFAHHRNRSSRSSASCREACRPQELHQYRPDQERSLGRTWQFHGQHWKTLVWKAFAKSLRKSMEEVPIIMKDVTILRATIMPKEGSVKFHVSIFDGSGAFELTESGSPVVTGHIFVSEGIDKDGTPNLKVPAPLPNGAKTGGIPLKKNEVYRDFRLRGYDYGGIFQGVKETDNFGANGRLEWANNWISFMDTMLQFSLIGLNTRELYVPTRILKVVVDPARHLEVIGDKDEVPVQMYRHLGVTRSGGVEIRGMKASLAPRRTGAQVQAPPKLEAYTFVPYENTKVDVIVASPDVSSLAAVLEPIGAKTSAKDITVEPVDESESFHVVCGSQLLRHLANATPTVK
ncbi:unnamed protein product, partial [Nesidiocoris tenuis]